MKDRKFHRSDFTGSEGPGLKKLRAAKPEKEAAPAAAKASAGLAGLRQLMRRGQWQDAILVAAKWSDLGDEKEAIQRGREAIMRPAFMRQLKRDPEAAIIAAKHALQRRYGA